MCGRYASFLPPELIARLFRTMNPLPNVAATWNLAPSQDALVVRRHPETGGRHLDLLRWGLLPYFTKDPAHAPRPINARAETVATSGMFKGAFARRRCLVPAGAFYEWKAVQGGKQPFAIARVDGQPMAFAGLWERFRWPDGDVTRSFTIITTDANATLAEPHNRMPVVLEEAGRHDWLIGAINKRLREEFGKLQVEINDEKSRMVDLARGESFGFLGFDFRYLRSLRGAWRPHYTPKLKKRTALMRELKAVFRRYRSQPIEQVINLINPVLRGWVNYFAVGHSSKCFNIIKDWVEKKVRRHLAHAQKRKGFGWERWSWQWLCGTLRLFNGYGVRYGKPKVALAG